jgi:hypothetical protein
MLKNEPDSIVTVVVDKGKVTFSVVSRTTAGLIRYSGVRRDVPLMHGIYKQDAKGNPLDGAIKMTSTDGKWQKGSAMFTYEATPQPQNSRAGIYLAADKFKIELRRMFIVAPDGTVFAERIDKEAKEPSWKALPQKLTAETHEAAAREIFDKLSVTDEGAFKMPLKLGVK